MRRPASHGTTQLKGELRQRHCATSSEHLRCKRQVWHPQKKLKVALWQALTRLVQSLSRSKSRKGPLLSVPNNKGGPSLKTPGKNTASDGLHAGAVAESWKPASLDEVANKLSDYFQMLLDSGWVPDESKSRDIFRLLGSGRRSKKKQDINGTDPMKSWRCLNLLNHSGKAFTRRAQDPFEQELVETTSRTQFGAGRGRSCGLFFCSSNFFLQSVSSSNSILQPSSRPLPLLAGSPGS